MKERGIIFSSSMVRATLEGRKSMDRRMDTKWLQVKKGDRLWVKELWQPIWKTEESPPNGLKGSEGWEISYPATDGIKEYYDEYKEELTSRCKSPVSMPRWASRITLEATADARLERLQEVSEEDCDKECFGGDFPDKIMPYFGFHGGMSLRECFAILWDSLNPKAPWSSNPEVVVLSFIKIGN